MVFSIAVSHARVQSAVPSALRTLRWGVAQYLAISTEQSQGVAQVGEAVSNMDQTTQRNAALVEEMAAVSSSLKGQTQELVQSVAVFKLAV